MTTAAAPGAKGTLRILQRTPKSLLKHHPCLYLHERVSS